MTASVYSACPSVMSMRTKGVARWISTFIPVSGQEKTMQLGIPGAAMAAGGGFTVCVGLSAR